MSADKTAEQRADEFIERMVSSGIASADRTIESIEEARERMVRLIEQMDRFPEEVLGIFGSAQWLDAFRIESGRDPEQEFFTLIRITDVPDGGAPSAIREQWVGTVLLTTSNEVQRVISGNVTDLEAEPSAGSGYTVETALAVSTLRNDGKVEAADWWTKMYRDQSRAIAEEALVFDADCAEPITLENAVD